MNQLMATKKPGDEADDVIEWLKRQNLELETQPEAMQFGGNSEYGARKRPDTAIGITPAVETSGGTLFVTINVDEEWNPFEVFVRVGKAGEDEYAHLEGLARLVSYCLRTGGDPRGIIDQLSGITSEPVWDKGVLVRSAEDGVALVLRRMLHGEYDSLLERAFGYVPVGRGADDQAAH